MTFNEIMARFPTEESAIRYYIKTNYPYGVLCKHCGSKKVYREIKRNKVFSCNACKSTFSIFKGTIFEKSSTDFRKWLYSIHLLLSSRKSVTVSQLQHEIGVTYKTAWRMLQKIRLSMDNYKH